MKNNNFFWVTNISNRNVGLADLNLTIKAYSSVNLLDKKHYSYNKEQLEKSAKSGSIFNKRNKIFVRVNSPQIFDNKIEVSNNSLIPTRYKSIYDTEVEHYEELDLLDEVVAEDNADMIDEITFKTSSKEDK